MSYVRCLPCVLLLLGVGCASVQQNPARHPRRNGEPLAVVENERTVTSIERENLVDMGGSSAGQGSASAFGLNIGRDVERERTLHSFLLTHGGLPVDEQDFYALAGDQQAFSEIKRARDEAVKTQETGYAVAPVGLFAGLIGGTALSVLALRSDGFDSFALGVGAGSVAFAGVIVAISGYGVGNVAKATLETPVYRFPVERARVAAEAHNTRSTKKKPKKRAPVSVARIEVSDDTECIDEAALRKDIEALVARADVRIDIDVVEKGRSTREITLTMHAADGEDTSRVFDVAIDECEDVPRVVSRILRAETSK